MNAFLLWFTIIILFFAVLPAAAVSIITVVRFFYRKIRKRKTGSVSRLVAAIVIAVVCLAVIPPATFLLAESTMKDVVLTDSIAFLSIDKNKPNIRYIQYDGKEYQELDTSIAGNEYFDYSEDAGLEYEGPVANVIFGDQSVIEKYVYYVFRYPVGSQLIYDVKNDGMDDCVSLDETTLFCDTDTIDERLAYYRDTKNYDYFVVDYNTDKYYDIDIDDESINEVNDLANLKNKYEYDDTVKSITSAVPGAVKLDVASDYDMYTLTGESKDKLILREIGEIYIDKDGKAYQLCEEIFNEDDGSVDLIVLPLSDSSSKKITSALKDAGAI